MMHVTRHTAASAWLSAGLSIGAVAEFLGDTEASDSHMMPDDRERARRAMERFFARPADGERKAAVMCPECAPRPCACPAIPGCVTRDSGQRDSSRRFRGQGSIRMGSSRPKDTAGGNRT